MATVKFVTHFTCNNHQVMETPAFKLSLSIGLGDEFIEPLPKHGQIPFQSTGLWLVELLSFHGLILCRFAVVPNTEVDWSALGTHLRRIGKSFGTGHGKWLVGLKPDNVQVFGPEVFVHGDYLPQGGLESLANYHGLSTIRAFCWDKALNQGYVTGPSAWDSRWAISLISALDWYEDRDDDGVDLYGVAEFPWRMSFSAIKKGEVTCLAASKGVVCWAVHVPDEQRELHEDAEDSDDIVFARLPNNTIRRFEKARPNQDKCCGPDSEEEFEPWTVVAILATDEDLFLVQDNKGKVYRLEPNNLDYQIGLNNYVLELELDERIAWTRGRWVGVYSQIRGTFWRLDIA